MRAGVLSLSLEGDRSGWFGVAEVRSVVAATRSTHESRVSAVYDQTLSVAYQRCLGLGYCLANCLACSKPDLLYFPQLGVKKSSLKRRPLSFHP